MSENEKMEQGQGSASASEKADKAKKDKKPEKQKKPSIFARIGKWLKDMKSELKKVAVAQLQADDEQHRDRHPLRHRGGHLHLAL